MIHPRRIVLRRGWFSDFLPDAYYPNLLMISKNGFLKPITRVLLLVALIAVFARCGSSDEEQVGPATLSASFMDTETVALDAKGYANNPAIVLTGPVGTAYTVTVTEGGKWCFTSRRTGATTVSGSLVTRADIVYIYLDENTTADSRHAELTVAFDGADPLVLTIDQATYFIPETLDHPWAELPAYVEDDDLMYVTHYAPLSSTKTARNYTICYDKTKRIANWVAYPVHSCYMQSGYTRLNTWAYDPDVPSAYQVDLTSGSYRGGGIRGHQCMSYHRWSSYSTLINEQTYYSTNIMPQDYDFNSGSWNEMEDVVSNTGRSCADTLFQVTGNWGIRSWSTDRSGTKVAMPEYCWKVLLCTRSGRTGKRIDQITDASELKAIGFWAKNSSSSAEGLKEYITSVSYIEQQTGYKFFTMLDDAIADEVKAQNNPSDWGIK